MRRTKTRRAAALLAFLLALAVLTPTLTLPVEAVKQSDIDALKEELGEYLQVRIVLRGEREMTSLGYCLYDDRVKLDGTLSEFVCGFFKTVLSKYKCSVC